MPIQIRQPRHRPTLLVLLLVLTAMSAARLWWVPMRCILNDRTFQWSDTFGFGQIAGQGMGGDFLILLLLSGYAVAMIYLGWTGSRPPFHAMAVLWFGSHLAGAIVSATQGGLIFHGDALGIKVNLTWISAGFNGLALVLALAWAAIDLRPGRERQGLVWTRRSIVLLVSAGALLPVQAVLFQIGPLHDPTDVVALFLTVIQWIILNAALAARQPVPALPEAAPGGHTAFAGS